MTDDLAPQPSGAQNDQAKLDLEAVLNLPQGRRFVMAVLERTGVYRNAFTGEAAPTDFRLGEQNIGLWLISNLNGVAPTTYPQLLLDVARDEKETVHVLDKG